jgi:crossover junction endodeoxyribonuclease RuvC
LSGREFGIEGAVAQDEERCIMRRKTYGQTNVAGGKRDMSEAPIHSALRPSDFPVDDPESRAKLEKLFGAVTPCFVGLDLSLTGSGVCVKRGDVLTVATIKTNPQTCVDDLARMIHIRDVVMGKIPDNTKMICIEDFFTGPFAGSGIRLAMLGAIVRVALYERGLSFMVVAPSTLKKHVLGKGVGEKSLILRAVYKSYGLEVANDNEADAVVLCGMGEQFYGALRGTSMDGTPKYQQEVMRKLMETRSDRGFNLSGVTTVLEENEKGGGS